MRRECQLTIVNDKDPVASLEAHGPMGRIKVDRSLEKAVAKAQEHGIDWVSVKGALLWPYPRRKG